MNNHNESDNNYSELLIEELVTVLMSSLGSEKDVKDEMIRRDPEKIIDYFNKLEEGFQKTILANFIIDNSINFLSAGVGIESVRIYANPNTVHSAERGIPDEHGGISLLSDYD